jgi:hypothetical protein
VQQLSDRGTIAFKVRFVGLVAAMTVAVGVGVSVFHDPRPTPLMTGFLLFVMLAAVAWSVRRYPWDLADEVVDEGSCLAVRRRSAQARIAFDDIAGVDREVTGFARNIRLTLTWAIPPFGTTVVFRPRDYGSVTTDELNCLIEELRSRAPRAGSPQHATEQRDSPAIADGGALHSGLIRKRVILAIIFLPFVLAAGNYLLGLKMFAPFDKLVMAGCMLAVVIALLFFGPTVAEMDREIDARIARKRGKAPT